MAYTDTCTISVTKPTSKVNTITIFSENSRGYFDYVNDFFNCFTEEQIKTILDDPFGVSDITATNNNGDTVVYNIDTTTFEKVVTETVIDTVVQEKTFVNETSENVLIITVVNPRIDGIFSTGYKVFNKIYELKPQLYYIFSFDGINDLGVIKVIVLRNGLEIKYGYSSTTLTVNLNLSYSETNILKSTSRADIIIDKNWVKRGDTNYSIKTGIINLNLLVERINSFRLNYYDNKKIKFKVGLVEPSTITPTEPNVDIKMYDEEKSTRMTFDIRSFFNTTNSQILSHYVYTNSNSGANNAMPFYINGKIYNNNIKLAPTITNIEVDDTDAKKVNIIIKNGVPGEVYYLFTRNVYSQPDGITGNLPTATDGTIMKEEETITLAT